MFEQAVLESSYGNRRAFATGAGLAGQAALAAFLVIAPMIWPQVLPSPRLTMTIAPPAPAPKPPEPVAAVRPRTAHSQAPVFNREILLPTRMPARPMTFVDAEPNEPSVTGVAGGIGTALTSDLLQGILRTDGPLRKPAAEEPKPKPPAEAAPPVRISSLDPGRLIHFIEPVYPQIAKSAHISGTVELRAVIGTDGRVRELTVVGGHPLLRNAAIDAVRQWIYKPPSLNGQSVELVAPISVIFRLN